MEPEEVSSGDGLLQMGFLVLCDGLEADLVKCAQRVPVKELATRDR